MNSHRICHIADAHASTDVRIFRKECTSLAAAGYETYLVAPGESREENGVHVVGIGPRPEGRIKRMTAFARKAYRTARALDCDVYHLHDPELLPYALKLKRAGKKVVFDSHEDYTSQIKVKSYLGGFTGVIAWFYHAFETYVAKRIDAVIIVGTCRGEDVFCGRAKRTVIVANEVILSEFDSVYSDSYKMKSNEFSVCYCGTLTEARGITNLVAAVHNAGAKLILAGPIAEAYLKRLLAMPEFSSVEYRGVANRQQIREIYSEAAIGAQLVLPVGQYYNGDVLGVKIGEYMACGMPILVSDTPFMKKVIGKYRCGVRVDATNIQAISDAIVYLREHPREAKEMGLNGRKAVEEEFNWGEQEKNLLELYSELLV